MKYYQFKILFFLLLSLAIMLQWSCNKDEDSSGAEGPISVNISTTLGGRVSYSNGQPAVNFKITSHGKSVRTDSRGFYILKNIAVPRSRVIVEAEGGFFKTVIPVAKKVTLCDISVGLNKNTHTLNSAQGGTVSDVSGVNILFQPNSLLTATGVLFTGQANIEISYLDPAVNHYSYFNPVHDNLMYDETGRKKFAYPFGTVKVELLSPAGDKLFLDEMKPASISIPISNPQNVVTPSTVLMSYFDEGEGIWKKEKDAVKTGNTYTADVTHFSWWGAVIPLGIANISGYVKDINGNGIANATVTSSLLWENARTNNSGEYNFTVADGLDYDIYCSPTWNMGEYANPTNTPVLSTGQMYVHPDIVFSNATIVSGSTVDCNSGSLISFVTLVDPTAINNYVYCLSSNNFNLFTGINKQVEVFSMQQNQTHYSTITASAAGTIFPTGAIQVCTTTPPTGNVSLTLNSPTTGILTYNLSLAYVDIYNIPSSPWQALTLSSDDSLYFLGVENYAVYFTFPMLTSAIPGTIPWAAFDTVTTAWLYPLDIYLEGFHNSGGFYDFYGTHGNTSTGTTTITQTGPVGSTIIGAFEGPVNIFDSSGNMIINGTLECTFSVPRRY